MNIIKNAKKVRGFDTSVIPSLNKTQKEYIADYQRRLKERNPATFPTHSDYLIYFKYIMLKNANRFKNKSNRIKYIPWLSKVRKNYEDMAEANYNKYLELK